MSDTGRTESMVVEQCLNILKENALIFRETYKEKPQPSVPPPTPTSDYGFDYTFEPLPATLPNLDDVKIPLVRQQGIKTCIRTLAEYLGCKEYKFNLLQFWFLDIVVDCLWKVQDEFKLPEKLQKTVLSWILYIVDVIRDPRKNHTRKSLFEFFKEAIALAAEVVDEGCGDFPTPENLFKTLSSTGSTEDSDSTDTSSSSSSISIQSVEIYAGSCIQLNLKDKPNCYVLKREICNCRKYDLSSIDSVSESTVVSEASQESKKATVMDEQEEESEIEFYKPNNDIPSRFLSSESEKSWSSIEEESDEEHSKCTSDKSDQSAEKDNVQTIATEEKGEMSVSEEKGEVSSVENENIQLRKYLVEEITDKCLLIPAPSQLTVSNGSSCSSSTRIEAEAKSGSSADINTGDDENNNEAEVPNCATEDPTELVPAQGVNTMKAWRHFKLWEKRNQDMNDPKIGWLPPKDNVDTVDTNENKDDIADEDEWIDLIENSKREMRYTEESKAINFALLWAIIDFVFEYFYENFQFTLIKLAFQACPSIIAQRVNEEWEIPKMAKGELQKPPEKKPKEEKPKKEKKKKKGEKKSQKGKKGKKKGKKDKSSKGSKKGDKKKKKDKSSKSSKNGKKSKKGKDKKPKKLTKKEKEELARLKREQAEEEERKRQELENKRFMFPLSDAADDDLFNNIFENWVKKAKPDVKKKKGKKDKKNKNKGGKKEKSKGDKKKGNKKGKN